MRGREPEGSSRSHSDLPILQQLKPFGMTTTVATIPLFSLEQYANAIARLACRHSLVTDAWEEAERIMHGEESCWLSEAEELILSEM